MDLIATYKKAETFREKLMCYIAKLIGAKYVTPLGRIILLPSDYKTIEQKYRVFELYPH